MSLQMYVYMHHKHECIQRYTDIEGPWSACTYKEIHLFGQPVVGPKFCGRKRGLWLAIITLLRRVVIHMHGIHGDASTRSRD